MEKIIRYAAYGLNVLMIVTVGVLAAQAYGPEIFLILLMALPPIVSLIALRTGTDLEERQLLRQVRKARLRDELAKLQK